MNGTNGYNVWPTPKVECRGLLFNATVNGIKEWQRCHEKYDLPLDETDCKYLNLLYDSSMDELFKCYKFNQINLTK